MASRGSVCWAFVTAVIIRQSSAQEQPRSRILEWADSRRGGPGCGTSVGWHGPSASPADPAEQAQYSTYFRVHSTCSASSAPSKPLNSPIQLESHWPAIRNGPQEIGIITTPQQLFNDYATTLHTIYLPLLCLLPRSAFPTDY